MAKIYIPSEGECEILDDINFMAEARTIRFSLDGIHYEVDLSAATCRSSVTASSRILRSATSLAEMANTEAES